MDYLGVDQGGSPHLSRCNSQHLSPLMAPMSWLQPVWDMVTQILLLYFHLPHHQWGQPFVACQTGSLASCPFSLHTPYSETMGRVLDSYIAS